MSGKLANANDMITDSLLSSLAALLRIVFSLCFNSLQKLDEFKLLLKRCRLFSVSLGSPNAKLCLPYIEMVGILLDLIRSNRTASWTLLLLTIRKMISWLFAYDRVNYSRYLTLYCCEMTALLDTHRGAYDKCLEVNFVFNIVPRHSEKLQ